MIEPLEEESTDSTNTNKESEAMGEVELEPANSSHQISLHALVGQAQLPDYRTIRLSGTVKNRRKHILIDSRSTHNFLNAAGATKLGCCAENIQALRVTVADENKLISSSICKAFKRKMQGLEFNADLLLLPLRGCDTVLGIQWLKRLGPILWDFSQLRIEFRVKGQKIVLRGSLEPNLKEGDQIATSKSAGTMWSRLDKAYSQRLQLLLEEHSNLFEEPQGLPPVRMHGHKIPLKGGTNSINVRPYRYPAYQKIEIEKLVQEMLSQGVIRPSNSPYSSQVVRVRKTLLLMLYRDHVPYL
uniref:Uncharacterized protein n=1 Tax=Ananas comosus var. bracteatus TaxID=296719 RepID=A0A6V7QMV4_ANACO|nr:unnamed protein product [Ananas comosus var. bracteatus]